MNAVFFTIFVLSVVTLIFKSPETVLSCMMDGGERAVQLSITMLAVYSVWLGLLNVAESCGVTTKIARALKKPVGWLFGKVGEEAEKHLSMNISANLLGMGGVATPMGIAAAKLLDAKNDVYAMNMLFVLAATSIQILPTSVIALRDAAGSISPSDAVLPTVIVTFLSTALGVLAVKIIYRRKKR